MLLQQSVHIIVWLFYLFVLEPTWPSSYGSWIYNYLCNQCLSPLMVWVRISIRPRCTTLCDKVCEWLAICRWCSLGPPVSSTNKTDCHETAEILLKIKQTNLFILQFISSCYPIGICKHFLWYLLIPSMCTCTCITIKVRDSIPEHTEVYSIQICVITFIIVFGLF